jgi:D-glycero-D-manno-heptose 1,7-bisphosphate phosphatase
MKFKGLFLDRDGVVNYDLGHVGTIERFKFKPFIFDLILEANVKKYKVIIITNQAGIARGLYSEKDFKYLNNWMLDEFKRNNCLIDDVYYCPYHPKQGRGDYLKDSFDRKPNPGMILKAMNKHNIHLQKSILVGDNITDMNAGKSSGIKDLYFINNKTPCEGVKYIDSLTQVELY